MKRFLILGLFMMMLLMGSCKKGHRVRVSNYYLEKLDSVVIGDHKITFIDVDFGQTTDYQSISSGDHSVRLVTEDGTVFYGLAPLAKGSGGDHTIQVDGLKAVSVFED